MSLKWKNHYKPTLQALEDRFLPTATAVPIHASLLTHGVLEITGTQNADNIAVTQSAGKIGVTGIDINSGGQMVSSVPLASVNKIEVDGQAGNDTIHLGATTLPTLIYEGPGKDTVTPSQGFNTYYEKFNLAEPVIGAASDLDIVQGRAANCQTLAALATVVSQYGTNWIDSHIRYLGGYLYQVYLEGPQTWVTVGFNGVWTDNDAVPLGENRLDPVTQIDPPELWPLIMDRARLETFGINVMNPYTNAQWDAINQKYNGELMSSTYALWQFTGRFPMVLPIGEATVAGLQWALANNYTVVAASFASSSDASNSFGIAPNHAYAVTEVFTLDGQQYVQLYNPWGFDAQGKTLDLAPGETAKNDGVITIPWTDFVKAANFSYVYVV